MLRTSRYGVAIAAALFLTTLQRKIPRIEVERDQADRHDNHSSYKNRDVGAMPRLVIIAFPQRCAVGVETWNFGSSKFARLLV